MDETHQPSVSPLDNHTISLLRSGVYLHSFTHALKALTEISIKSNPTSIFTSIDPESGSISVDDNGIGIDKRLVSLFGRFDSKSCVSPPQGSAPGLEITSYLSRSQHQILDSLAHLSLLDICSRPSDSSYTHQTLFKEGQVIFSAPAKTSRRHNRGTTTTVRNLFYNLPVRQIKETDPNRLQIRLRRLWNESKIIIQSLAIIHPNITFTLRNSSTNHLPPLDQSSCALNQCSFYRISKTGSSTSAFGKVFGHQFVRDSIPLNFTLDGFKVTGLFAKNRHASRSSQLIYLDRVLINPNNSLHKTLANLFVRLTSQDTSTLSLEHGLVSTNINSVNKSVNSTVDRYPVYLILFSSDCFPSPQQPQPLRFDNDVHHFFDEKEEELVPRTEEKLNKIITKIFSQVFPLITTHTQEVATPTPCSYKRDQSKLIRSNHSSNNRNTLDSQWPVTKRARLSNQSISLNKPLVGCRHENSGGSVERESKQIEPLSSKQKMKDYLSSSASKLHAEELNSEEDRRSTINAKHETSLPGKENPTLESVKTISNLKSRFECKVSRSRSDSNRPALRSPRLVPNKAFTPTLHLSDLKSRFQYEPPVRGSTTSQSNNGIKKPIRTVVINNRISSNTNSSGGSSQLLKSRAENLNQSTELRRIDLSKFSNSSTFTVVGQLDLKFIIVKIHGHGGDDIPPGQREGKLIVAFDQHAVHERIRIEKFLKDMCTGNFKTKKLTLTSSFDYNDEREEDQNERNRNEGNLFPILVNRIEFEGLVKFKKHFERWGILYETKNKSRKEEETRYEMEGEEGENFDQEEEEFKQIYMFAVPELIWDRINSEGIELIKKVLKGCLGFFEDRARDLSLNLAPFDPSIEPGNLHQSCSTDWFKFVKDCPTVLVDLLNSKACRGSIMFGDELEESVCSKLIVKLSQTHLPFSCAHGRPTCFPLFKFPTSASTSDLHPASNLGLSWALVSANLDSNNVSSRGLGDHHSVSTDTNNHTYRCKKNHQFFDWKSLFD